MYFLHSFGTLRTLCRLSAIHPFPSGVRWKQFWKLSSSTLISHLYSSTCTSGDYFPQTGLIFKMVKLAQAGERDVSTLYEVPSFVAIFLPCWIWGLISEYASLARWDPVPQSLLGFVIIPERRFETRHLSLSAAYWASSSQHPTDFKQVPGMEQSQGIGTQCLSGFLSDPERTLWSQ